MPNCIALLSVPRMVIPWSPPKVCKRGGLGPRWAWHRHKANDAQRLC